MAITHTVVMKEVILLVGLVGLSCSDIPTVSTAIDCQECGVVIEPKREE